MTPKDKNQSKARAAYKDLWIKWYAEKDPIEQMGYVFAMDILGDHCGTIKEFNEWAFHTLPMFRQLVESKRLKMIDNIVKLGGQNAFEKGKQQEGDKG